MQSATYTREDRWYAKFPAVGCVAVLLLLPFLFMALDHAMFQTVPIRLHLTPAVSTLVLFAILLGGFLNVPLMRWQRDDFQMLAAEPWLPPWRWTPLQRRSSLETLVSLNVGGCLVPLLLAAYEIAIPLQGNWHLQLALLLAVAGTAAASYQFARAVPGIGIVVPGILPPLMAVGTTWLLLGGNSDYAAARAPIALVAGVVGTLVGAYVLRWRDVRKCSAALLSIGGTGVYDGIVLAVLAAALLA